MMFRVLGPLEVETDQERTIPLPGQRPRALLTAFLLQPNTVVPTHRLVEALWGEDPPDAPANALQRVVARLRSQLGTLGTAIVTRPPGYLLVAEQMSIDAERFESEYGTARSMWATEPAKAATLLDGALALWRGPAYGEFAEGFARAAATRLEELRVAALEDRAALLLQSGAVTDAIASSRELMAGEPLRERPVELLMHALHADGRAGEALEVFRQHRELIADELGIDPAQELRALQERILHDDVGTARARRPPVAPSNIPQPQTLAAPGNLPTQLTSFIGRDSEVAETKALLATTRLLTVTGPGGTGKTRLALKVAADVSAEFPDGAFFVDLAPVADPALVVPTIAATLGIREEGWEQPVTAVLLEHLEDRRLLLVLDNFEQVLDAAALITQLLSRAPALTVLVTSRAPLRVRGEQVMPLRPLRVADARLSWRQLSSVESVVLFAQRASAAAPHFALTEQNAQDVAEIVARLDGLPLAIELAASRAAVLAPRAMLQRIEGVLPLLVGGARDLPARQQTLRATIGWSYELLEEPGRILFRRLSVLAGGFTVEAAAAVCDGDGDLALDVLQGVTILAENSLVSTSPSHDGDVRFGMLQTLREFGRERLDAEDHRLLIEHRHAQWFLRLAENAEPGLRGPQLVPWLIRLETEHDNLRAALGWAIERDEGEIALRLVGALWRFWHLAGHLSEGRRWVTAVLDLPSAAGQTVARARALAAAGGLAYWQNDVPAVRDAYEQALAISRELGDEPNIAEGTYNLAFAYGLVPTKTRSRDLFLQSREMFQRLGNAAGVADTLWALGMMAGLAGDYATARSHTEESVRLHRELGNSYGLVDALGELGRATRGLGELEIARSCFLEALDALASVGYRTAIALELDNLAAIEIALGHDVRALHLAGAAAALKEAAGGQVPPEFADLPDPRDVARRSLSEERIAAAWNEGRAMSLNDAIAFARAKPAAEGEPAAS
jgi:predicted ATPase/DNA-binding SARP family transcriptional activator